MVISAMVAVVCGAWAEEGGLRGVRPETVVELVVVVLEKAARSVRF
jgi:hypothetical protein